MSTPAAASRPVPPSMSLSRRFLSLPQELTGCSLPPQVFGRRYGVVTLCVAHILESAVSSHPLPRVSLVRVRWWGEDAPGSLFRPALLSADGLGLAQNAQEAQYTPRRAIAMKYQVSVLPEQLLGYFQDMGSLTLEVIDRDTRKKVGECSLRMDLQASNSVMTAQEKLVALRRQDELCEIKPMAQDAQDGEVLGYLAVTFDVQWPDLREEMDMGREVVVEEVAVVENVDEEGGELSATSDSLPVKKVWIEAEKAGERVDMISVQVEEQQVLNDSKRRKEGVVSESSGDFERIQKLLEKGKALRRSMERAVAEEVSNENELDGVDEAPERTSDAYFEAKYLLSFATEAKFSASTSKWKDTLGNDRHIQNTAASKSLESASLASSIRSSPSEVSERQTKEITSNNGKSLAKAMLQKLQREVNTPTQPEEALKSSVPGMRGCESLQFAVLLEDVSNVRFSATEDAASGEGNHGNEFNVDVASISLHYTVPSRFSTLSPASSDKFNRTATRKVRKSRWLDSASSLRADFSGSIHVFQSSFAEDASEYFQAGYLIIEVWLNFRVDAERKLLGLSKVPLRQLAKLFRGDMDTLSVMERPLPFVGVDDKLVIENPFTGNPAGYLSVRVAVGTAEQLLAWATTARTIVRVQAVIRGYFLRKHLRGSRAVLPLSELGFRDTASSSRVIGLSSDDTRSDSRSTAPTISTTLQQFQSLSLDESCSRGDDSDKRSETLSKDSPLFEANSASWLALRKIRFDVHESWRSTVQQSEQSGGKQPQRDWTAAPVLGCELQGQLVLSGGVASKGLLFALWWDAADRRLNSAFAHTFRAAGVGADLPLVGPQSQVLFALHVENGFFGTQSRETIMGEARLNLFEAFHRRGSTGYSADSLAHEESSVAMNAPIEWDSIGREYQGLPGVIPLKISYHVVPLVIRPEEAAGSGSDVLSSDGSAYAGDQQFGSIATSHDVQTSCISAEESDERLVQESGELRDRASEVTRVSPFAASSEAFGGYENGHTGRWEAASEPAEHHISGSASTCAAASSAPGSCAPLEDPSSNSAADVADSVSSAEEEAPGSDDGSLFRSHGEVDLSVSSQSPKESEIAATSDFTAVHESDNDGGLAEDLPVDGTGDGCRDREATPDVAPSTQKTANANEGVNQREHIDRSFAATVIYTAGEGGVARDGQDKSSVASTSSSAVDVLAEAESTLRSSVATAGIVHGEDQSRHNATVSVTTSDNENGDDADASQSQFPTNSDVPASESVGSEDGSAEQREHDAGMGWKMPGNAAGGDDQSHDGAEFGAVASDHDTDDVTGFDLGRHSASSVVSTSGDAANTAEGVFQSKRDASLVMSSSAASDADEAGQDQSEACSSVPTLLVSASEDEAAGPSGHGVLSGTASPDKAVGVAADGLSLSEEGLDLCVSTEENAADGDVNDMGAFQTGVSEEVPAETLASSSESISGTSMSSEIPRALDNIKPANLADTDMCVDELWSKDSPNTDEQQPARPDTRSVGSQVVQYADKATQVEPSEFEIVPKSISTTSADQSNICNDGKSLSDGVMSPDRNDGNNEQSTVDVGCDPITVACVSSSGDTNPDESIQAPPPSNCQDAPAENEDNVQALARKPAGVEVAELGSEQGGTCEQPPRRAQPDPFSQDAVPSQSRPHIEPIPTPAHPQKLDLVYEMLREMRDSYFARSLPEALTQAEPLTERDSDVEELEEQTEMVPELPKTMQGEHERTPKKRCSCPNSPLSRASSSSRGGVMSLEMNSPDEKLERSFQGTTRAVHESVLDLTRTSQAQPIHQRLETTTLVCGGKSASDSLRQSGGRGLYRATGANARFSASHAPVSRKLYDVESRVEGKDDRSSVHSLFARDSETERIARIMQGSMKYWLKEDSSSSCNDDASDEEETDDDCYF